MMRAKTQNMSPTRWSPFQSPYIPLTTTTHSFYVKKQIGQQWRTAAYHNFATTTCQGSSDPPTRSALLVFEHDY